MNDSEATFVDHEEVARGFSTSPHRDQLRNRLRKEYSRLPKEVQDEVVARINKIKTEQSVVDRERIRTEGFWRSQSIDFHLEDGDLDDKNVQKALEHLDTFLHRTRSLLRFLNELIDTYQKYGFPQESIDWVRGRIAWLNPEIVNLEDEVTKLTEYLQDSDDESDEDSDVFLNEPLSEEDGFEGNWIGLIDLGGGMSRAGLWARFGRNGVVIDQRIVRKQELYAEKRWKSSAIWHGDHTNPETRKPFEYYIQNKCAFLAPDHFVKIRSWGENIELMAITLYVEYCAHGDRRVIEKNYAPKANAVIPEPFLWDVFLQLAETCLFMKQGGLESQLPGWDEQIVHRDIKPGNVFLDVPRQSIFPRYPTPKLADFGLAIFTSQFDDKNSTSYRGAGTRGYLAPEQAKKTKHQLLDHTNIFAIGATMFALCGKNGQRLSEDDQMNYDDPNTKWKFSSWSKSRYSCKLLSLIERCLQWTPEARPSPKMLRYFIKDYISKMLDPKGEYTRKAMSGEQPQSDMMDLHLAPALYKIGFCPGNQAPKRKAGEALESSARPGGEDGGDEVQVMRSLSLNSPKRRKREPEGPDSGYFAEVVRESQTPDTVKDTAMGGMGSETFGR